MEPQVFDTEKIVEKKLSCEKCFNFIKPNAKFCHHCGKRANQGYALVAFELKNKLTLIFGYYFSLLGFLVFLYATDFQQNTSSALISDCLFAAITIGFAIQNYAEIRPLFSFENVHLKILLILAGAEIVFAFGVTHFSEFLNSEFFSSRERSYSSLYQDSSSPFFFTLLSVALFPAIFEELGFRGVLFNHLSKVTSSGATIIVTAAMFTIIHLSLISLIWILPLGLLFAYLRNKYNTLWYGIAGHFIYNGSIVVLEFLKEGRLF